MPSRSLDDPAPVLSDLRINQFLAVRLELTKRAFLVGAHQPTVASNVASKNRGKPPVNAIFSHARPLGPISSRRLSRLRALKVRD
jgi:hypothetical protein